MGYRLLDGRLSLTTPEGVRLLLTPAGPYLRAAAWLLDVVIFVAAMFAITLVTALFGGGKVGESVRLIFMFVLFWGYPILCEVYLNGQTMGKRATGLAVVRSDGLPVGWRESMLRNLLLVADFLPIFYMTGLLSIMLDTRFRRIGDIVAGTLVVHKDKKVVQPHAPHANPLPLPFVLNPDQQRTLSDLFERESSLPVERMAELGTIAEPLTGRSGRESVEQMRSYVAGFTQ
jgi:uncharacterized RDD family membrane protein YckC